MSHLTGAFASHSELWATSDVGKEARNAIIENLESIFYGVDVGLNRQRIETNSCVNFVYKSDEEIDSMSIEDIREYEKHWCNSLKELIQNDEPNTKLVCVTVTKKIHAFEDIFLVVLDTYHCIFKNNWVVIVIHCSLVIF